MSSRRNNAYSNGGNYNRNVYKGPPRERNQRQISKTSYEPEIIESRAIQLIHHILDDKDDSSFSLRSSNANQLLQMLEESRNTISDSLEFRQEQMKLLDICVHDEGLRRIIEFSKAPSTLKNTMAKIVSGLACYTRLDLALSWIFDRLSVWQVQEYAHSDINKVYEWKKWLLRLLKQILADSQADQYAYKKTLDLSPTILAGVISFLNTMDTQEYIPIILEILVYFSENYQNLFGQHFKDVIDLLIGWNMDPELSELKKSAIISSYSKFTNFWANYLPFGVELLGHFLNDMQYIIRELASLTNINDEEYSKRWRSCFNLLECFQAILNVVLSLLLDPSNTYHSQKAVDISFDNLFPRLLSLIIDAQNIRTDLKWDEIAKNVILSLASYKPSNYRAYQYKLYHYLMQNTTEITSTEEQNQFQTVIRFLSLWDQNIDENIVYHLLASEDSPLFTMRIKNRNDNRIKKSILNIVRLLIRMPVSDNVRNQINHRYINELIDKQHLIKQYYSEYSIKDKDGLKRTTALIDQNDGSTAFTVPKESIENTSQNWDPAVVVEDALFFNYLLLDAATVWPALSFENVLTSLEFLCVTWCNKCNDIFDASFQLLNNYWTNEDYRIKDEYEFEMLSCLLLDFLDHWPKLSLQTRQTLFRFVQSIFSALNNDYYAQFDPKPVCKPVVIGFLNALDTERNNDIKEHILKLITFYCQVFGSADIIDSILEHVQRSINNPHRNVQEASKELLAALNPFAISEVNKFDDNTTMSIQNIMMATSHTGSFRPIHYEIVMRHLGMSEHLVASGNHHATDDKRSLEWVRRLLHHCDGIGNMKSVNLFGELEEELGQGNIAELINNSEYLLSYWAMWESARYCVLSRLRTPFGSPQQTFAAFERMLHSLVSEENNDKNNNFLRHLLLLLDRLELQISNAIDGCATDTLPAVPRSSLVFFRTNKKTCHDYFLRIREKMILGAKITRDDHLLISHTIKILKELESSMSSTNLVAWFTEINGYLRDLVEACIREKYMDLIYGMKAWYKKLVKKAYQISPEFKNNWSFEGLFGPLPQSSSKNSSVTWFQVAALFASNRDEMAIKSLDMLKAAVGNDDFGIISMLDRQMIRFFTSLEDYDKLQQILNSGITIIDDFICESLRELNSNIVANEEKQAHIATELQKYVKDAPLEYCLELTKLNKFKSWATMPKTALINQDSEPESRLDTLLAERILQALKNSIFTNIPGLLELQLLQPDWQGLIESAKEWVDLNISGARHVRSLLPETKHWVRLSTYFEKLNNSQHVEEKYPDAASYLGHIQLHSAKIARKQGNISLAEDLINKAITVPDTKYLALYERTKVLFLQFDYTQAMRTANDVLSHVASTIGCEELKSKTYLRVARYLSNCPENEASGLLEQLDPNIIEMKDSGLQSSVEASINDALQKSIENNTIDGRPWFEYATHYYKQGWRILDEVSRPDSSMPAVVWAGKKIRKTVEAIEPSVNLKQIEKTIFGLLIKYSSSVGKNDIMNHEGLANELHQATPFLSSTDEYIIIETLNTLQEIVIEKFRASAQAYFRYLSLDIHNHAGENISNINSTSMVLTATLRLLRILTKYGEALQSVYSEHIDMVRVELWKPVIPQLFAQLNHPNDFVRQIISKLVSRICDEYPREIIYDVIVNSTSAKTSRDTKQSLDAIANRMMDRNELLWVSTRRMAEELEKITVLLEERWLNKIASLQYEAMQQFSKLDQEKEKFKNLFDEKKFMEMYDSAMKFVIISIDKLLVETIHEPASLTPHEQWFQQMYGKQLTDAYHLLRKPTSVKGYRRGWECFQQLHRQFMAETHKVRIIDLSQVSPYLYNMKNTPIGIPGQHEDESSCFIDSFGSNVIVLPTKTKPKKLDLKGSDGRKYSYLFKGLEDLHLDERIMQLLTTTNGLLSENKVTALRGMRARTYAVIPLSDHSGMIQWVNEATPFFSVYKKWQKRESTAHMILNNDKPNEAYLQALNQRPTEQFMSKIASILKASGLRVTSNRRYWPKDVLKKVYLELVKETPGDLLEKKIYYSSSSATEWFKKSTSFARSLAVNSMIGYIIGLGDRHLDNIMIDFRSGEVIHIDYNVCFEKGRRLRVPELVPYRLTQNIYGALGITGVDGQFKTAAEETLRVLRKHKEVLITLLDAFIYDPLVDWESEAVEAGHRQMMELQANVSLAASKITEKQAEQENERKNILDGLSKLKHNLQQWQESVILEAESLNAEETSDEEDQALNNEPSIVSAENESSSFLGRLPIYVLREVKAHLTDVTLLVTDTHSSIGSIFPLLESIIIIETDIDNELRPAQKSAKMALDALSAIDVELKKLDKQLAEKTNYESEWGYVELMNLIETITKSVEVYFAELKTLEEFGPDSNKTVSNISAASEDSSKRLEDEYNEENTNQNISQGLASNKLSTNNHVTKIMKRIRSKLEGFDFRVQHKMSISEQVARSIEQATSVDNLCMMYEGWTSWV
ncbi:MAG: hypothetical protein EXX96DRAFT_603026 [Benjaminiella poitrasii]|nr:MAG: hypothetical protein EXX96DRAFT_603026 [Benjaminiella poitrasii]